MNINTLTNYVNQEVDDTYTVQEITRWFNKGIANYNLIPPLTLYPIVQFGVVADTANGIYNDATNYPLDDNFMLAVMLPYLTSSVRASESAVQERQLYMQDFIQNAILYKKSIDIPLQWMRNKKNEDLSNFEIGEGVFLGDFTRSPFAGDWQRPSIFSEIVAEEDEE
jgi:hypothetical protein